MHNKASLERFSFYRSSLPCDPTNGCLSAAVGAVNCSIRKKKGKGGRKPPREMLVLDTSKVRVCHQALLMFVLDFCFMP